MVSDFFATTVDDWSHPSGALHAYLVPDAQARTRMVPALEAAGCIPFLAAQPADSLHATILRLPVLVRDLTDDDVALIKAEATRSGTALGPITLEFGSPCITSDSLLVRAPAGGRWDALIALVREVGARAFGPSGTQYPSPWAPHMTVAYAVANGDDDVIVSALTDRDAATTEVGSVTFTRIAWCGVHQNRDAGTYTFDVLFETPLRGPSAHPPRTAPSPPR